MLRRRLTQLYSLAEALRSAAMEGRAVAMTEEGRLSAAVQPSYSSRRTGLVQSSEKEAQNQAGGEKQDERSALLHAISLDSVHSKEGVELTRRKLRPRSSPSRSLQQPRPR